MVARFKWVNRKASILRSSKKTQTCYTWNGLYYMLSSAAGVSFCLLKAGFPSRLSHYLRQAPPLRPSVCSWSSSLICSFLESHEGTGELSTVGVRSQGSPNVSFSAESQASVFPCTLSHFLFPLQLYFHCYFLAQDFRTCCSLFWNSLS